MNSTPLSIAQQLIVQESTLSAIATYAAIATPIFNVILNVFPVK